MTNDHDIGECRDPPYSEGLGPFRLRPLRRLRRRRRGGLGRGGGWEASGSKKLGARRGSWEYTGLITMDHACNWGNLGPVGETNLGTLLGPQYDQQTEPYDHPE